MSALPAFLTKLAPAELAHLVDETHRQKGGLTILDLMKRFEATFSPPEDWQAWRSFLAALFGLPMSDGGKAIFRACTGRQTVPSKPYKEAHLIVGRRGGKSRVSALIAVYLGAYRNYSKYLAPGERGTVMVIAADRQEARAVFGYIEGFIEADAGLAALVESRTKEAIHLKNRVTIEVHTASFRAVRGYTVLAAICDEIAFWRNEDAANPDTEILAAIRPGMATVPGAVLLCLSSPYARKGALWEAYDRYFGQDDAPVLVWQAETRIMHPSIEQAIIDRAYSDDSVAADAEYGANFRRDIESYVSREAIKDAVDTGREGRAPVEGLVYFAFVDPSSGSQDSFTLAVAHHEGGKYVQDALDEYPPGPDFNPDRVVGKAAARLNSFGLRRVTGDRHGGIWLRDFFRKYGIAYVESDLSKSEIYQAYLPLMNNRNVVLLDNKKLAKQLQNLERHIARGGRESIDHPPGGHDDLANATAGAIEQAARIGQHIAPVVDQRKLSPMETRKLEYQEAVRRALGGEESDRSERYQEMGW